MLTYVTICLGVLTAVGLLGTVAHAADGEGKDALVAALVMCLNLLAFVFMLVAKS